MSDEEVPRTSLRQKQGERKRQQYLSVAMVSLVSCLVLSVSILIPTVYFALVIERKDYLAWIVIFSILTWAIIGYLGIRSKMKAEGIPFLRKHSNLRMFIDDMSRVIPVVGNLFIIGVLFFANFQQIIVGATLLIQIFLYISYSSIGAIPSRKSSLWFASLCGLIIFVIVFLMPYEAVLSSSGLTVEILGAFIGVFAAIALGEMFKDIGDIQEGIKLRNLIFEELLGIEQQLEKQGHDQIPNPVWNAARGDGSILKLQSDFRRKVSTAYAAIQHSNRNKHETIHRQEALKSIGEVIE